MKQCFAVLSSLLLVAGCDVSLNTNASGTQASAVVVSDPGSAQRLVVDTAVQFLMLLDAGRTDMTWVTAGSALKATTTESNWVKGIGTLRIGLGELKQRDRAQITFTKQLPDAPPGHYAAVQTQSAFSNLTVTEAVLLAEENEQWCVVGYNLSKTVEVAAKMRLF